MSAPVALAVQAQKRLGDFALDVGLEAPAGGVTALFGSSGAGKSLTLAMIAGAVRPDAGRITLGDDVLFDRGRGIDVPMERRRVGWVFQDGRLFPHLSVRANLDYGARRARESRGGVDFDEAVDILGLAELLHRRPATLSGGERQRVAIGRALLARPALLLMDEPLASLDQKRRAAILPYLERLKTRCRLPILYVTHALAEVVRLADRLAVIEDGAIAAQGSVAEVMSTPGLALTARSRDAVSLIEGRLQSHAPDRGLSRVAAGETIILTPLLAREVGSVIRVAVLARDVLLARERPPSLSARNLLPGRIDSLAEADGDVVLARVRLVGGAILTAAITPDAREALALAPGVEVFAIVKSLAVEDGADGGLLAALER